MGICCDDTMLGRYPISYPVPNELQTQHQNSTRQKFPSFLGPAPTVPIVYKSVCPCSPLQPSPAACQAVLIALRRHATPPASSRSDRPASHSADPLPERRNLVRKHPGLQRFGVARAAPRPTDSTARTATQQLYACSRGQRRPQQNSMISRGWGGVLAGYRRCRIAVRCSEEQGMTVC
jgi:hypothetical protein